MSGVIDMVEVLDEGLYPDGLTVGYDTDAGVDLALRHPALVQISGGRTTRIGTGVALHLPPGHVGLICPRSSAADNGFIITTTVVDPGYEGEVHVWVTCLSPTRYQRGEKLVQLIVLQNVPPEAPARKKGPRGEAKTGSSDHAVMVA